jgi:hypothetical protein
MILYDSQFNTSKCTKLEILCEISGFYHGVDEVFALLGCYTVYVGICLPMFQDIQLVPSLRIHSSWTA